MAIPDGEPVLSRRAKQHSGPEEKEERAQNRPVSSANAGLQFGFESESGRHPRWKFTLEANLVRVL